MVFSSFCSVATQKFLDCPLDGEVTQVGVVLADADEEDGDVCGVDEADEGADHVADGVALGDDEAVEGADGAEGGVEVAGLGDGVCAYEGLRYVSVLVLEGEWKGVEYIPRRP